MDGLSPRARGNQAVAVAVRLSSRSIPAGAGEPSITARAINSTSVYPRGRGGTSSSSPRSRACRGLSPRARGNHWSRRIGVCPARSIPAGAGEPLSWQKMCGRWTVYPRGRGGTRGRVVPAVYDGGLSPRARGNLEWRRTFCRRCRSIPAGAGEPLRAVCECLCGWVYPRGRGGTATGCRLVERVSGLSPRARGNLGQAPSVFRR